MARQKLTDEERKAKKKAQWAKISNGEAYNHYEGQPGDPEQWIRGFEKRMGIVRPEVKKGWTVETALKVFNLKQPITFTEIKRSFFKFASEQGSFSDQDNSAEANERSRNYIEAYKFLQENL